MRKYIVLFFSALLLLAACHSTPAGVLNPKQMTQVLTDIHIVDGELGMIPQIPDSTYKYGMAKYLEVFKKDHVDSAEFRWSFKYYTMHPEQLVTIYDSVLARLSTKTDSITRIIAKNNLAQAKASPGNTSRTKPAPGSMTPVTPPGQVNFNRQRQQQIQQQMQQQRLQAQKHAKQP
jgi:hypothetical protein